MKIFVFLLSSTLYLILNFDNSIYELSFENTAGETINMVSYKGKKIIVTVCRTDTPNQTFLTGLKELSIKNQRKLEVILIPVSGLGETQPNPKLDSLLLDSLRLPFIVSRISAGKKTDGVAQHPLLKWLTDKSENGHFDNDLQNENRLFVINENGKLYADLSGEIDLDGEFVNNIINYQDPQ